VSTPAKDDVRVPPRLPPYVADLYRTPLLSPQSPVPLSTRIVSTEAPEISRLETAPARTGTPAKHKEQSSSAFLVSAGRNRVGCAHANTA